MTVAVVDPAICTTTVEPSKKQERVAMAREEREAQWPALKGLATPKPTKQCEQAWVAVFTAHPEVMVRVLQDIIKQTYAVPGRIGQRPMPKEEEVDLHALLHGEFSDEPLIKVLPKLMRGMSERAFCSRIFMSRTQFQRMMKGDYEPDMNEIRMIAAVVRKSPAFFTEYRILAAQKAFVTLITDRPGIATKLYRNYLEVKAPRRRAATS